MSKHINVLLLINDFIYQHSRPAFGPVSVGFPRQELTDWVTKRDHPDTRGKIDLAVDCLIAAGFGVEGEQGSTVYCMASYS